MLKTVTVVTFVNGTYFLSVDRKLIAKAIEAGFHYNPLINKLTTKSKRVAARFRKFFDDKAKNEFMSFSLKITPWSSRPLIPKNKTLRKIQEESIQFVMERNHSFLALEQRIGKTPIAIAVMNTLKSKKTLICVPPFLLVHWKKEIKEWSVKDYNICVVRTSNPSFVDILEAENADIILVPDSVVSKPGVEELLKKFRYDLFIGDEWHRFNNSTSLRTKSFYDNGGYFCYCDKILLLSGTPARAKILDLYIHIDRLASNLFHYMSKTAFAMRYCDGYIADKVYYKRGIRCEVQELIATGASNVEEFNNQISDFMKVEKLKSHFDINEVENIVLLDTNASTKIFELEKAVLKKYSIEELIGSTNLGDIATYRSALSEIILSSAIPYIENALEVEEKLIVFGIHTELMESLNEHFSRKMKTGIITGKVKMSDRPEIQHQFNNGDMRIIFANIHTMQGIDLSASNRNIFVESSWTPADNEQAKFRAYSATKHKCVYTEHLVLANTLSEYVMKRVLEKRKTINNIKGENNG